MTKSSRSSITCIFHLPKNSTRQEQIRRGIWEPLQTGSSYTIQWVAIGEKESGPNWFEGIWTDPMNENDTEHSSVLKIAFKRSKSSLILYIDNSEDEVFLKGSCANLFLIAAERYPDSGMFFSDYDLLTENKKYSIRLLKHHSGRVRNDQDHGKVFLFRKEILHRSIEPDNTLKYHLLYDLRLKISEISTITHISNKEKGSL